MKTQLTPIRALVGAVCAVSMLAGCATGTNPDTVRRADTQRAQTVEFGSVTSVRPMTVQGNSTMVGTATGAVLGGVLGSNLGGGSTANTVGAVGGAVAGGMAGNAIQRNASQRQGMEITVSLDSGRTMAVIQEGSPDAFRPGDRVRVTSDGVTTRVSR